MIKQLKMGIRMLRYGFGIKTSLIFVSFFLIVGVVLSLFPLQLEWQSSFFILINGMWAVQLIYSVCVSNLVQTSPWKKAMQTSIPAIICFLVSAVLYLLTVLLRLPHLASAGPQEMPYITGTLIFDGFLVFFIMIYVGMAYKLFIFSTVLFFGIFMSITLIYQIFIQRMAGGISFGAAVVIGFLEIVAGAFAEYGISLLVYKLPLAKGAQFRVLQKYM